MKLIKMMSRAMTKARIAWLRRKLKALTEDRVYYDSLYAERRNCGGWLSPDESAEMDRLYEAIARTVDKVNELSAKIGVRGLC